MEYTDSMPGTQPIDPHNDEYLAFLIAKEDYLNHLYHERASLTLAGLLNGTIRIGDLLKAKNKAAYLKAKFRSVVSAKIAKALAAAGVAQGPGWFEAFGKKFFYVHLEEAPSGFLPIVTHDSYNAKRFLKEDSIVIDAGANIGIFSAFAANLCPQGRVYAFEPASITFGALRKNADQYGNITATQSGLGDASAVKTLRVRDWALGQSYMEDSAMPHDHPGEWMKSEDARIVSLDEFVEKNGLPRVDFIKMDTEGYELKILKGAANTIRKFSPVMVMSAYHVPSDKTEIPKYVLSLNPRYQYELHEGDEENFTFWTE